MARRVRRSQERSDSEGEVAQSVEQRTENPRVGSSILPLATIFLRKFDDFETTKKSRGTFRGSVGVKPT